VGPLPEDAVGDPLPEHQPTAGRPRAPPVRSTCTGVETGRPVGNRTIGADLEMLLRALRWAVRERTRNGKRLLTENPLAGVRLPSEKNPRPRSLIPLVDLRIP